MFRILVAEDDKEIRDGIGIYLRNQGYQVFPAENGRQGLELLEREAIHLAIVDIMMPVMDGLTATKTIRSLERQEAKTIPIFAMTANAFLDDKKQSKEAGMNEHLSKPLDEKKLMNTIWKYTIGKNSNSKE